MLYTSLHSVDLLHIHHGHLFFIYKALALYVLCVSVRACVRLHVLAFSTYAFITYMGTTYASFSMYLVCVCLSDRAWFLPIGGGGLGGLEQRYFSHPAKWVSCASYKVLAVSKCVKHDET